MMNEPPTYRLHDSLGYQLSLTARSVERRFEDGLKGLALTRVFWCVLLAVGVEKLGTPSRIAAFIGIDRTATSRALRQMESAGLIRRSCGAADRRTTEVSLTDKGRELLDRSIPLARENAARVAERLTADELAALKSLLAKARSDDALPLAHL